MKAAVAAWSDVLADVPVDRAVAAVRELAAEDRAFAPSPGTVRARIRERFGAGCPVCGRFGTHAHLPPDGRTWVGSTAPSVSEDAT